MAESFGGRDEPVDPLVQDLVNVGAEMVGAALRVKAQPTQSLYQQFEEAGTDLAQVSGCRKAIEYSAVSIFIILVLMHA